MDDQPINNNKYSYRFCDERHTKIDKEIDILFQKIKDTTSRVDTILMRLNIILGGIVVACILLAINIGLK